MDMRLGPTHLLRMCGAIAWVEKVCTASLLQREREYYSCVTGVTTFVTIFTTVSFHRHISELDCGFTHMQYNSTAPTAAISTHRCVNSETSICEYHYKGHHFLKGL
jgi:hypothetical protein